MSGVTVILSDRQIALMAARASSIDSPLGFKEWAKSAEYIDDVIEIVKTIRENFSVDVHQTYAMVVAENSKLRDRFMNMGTMITFMRIAKMLIEFGFNHTYEEV